MAPLDHRAYATPSSAAIELPPRLPAREPTSPVITESWIHRWALKLVIGVLTAVVAYFVIPAIAGFVATQDEHAETISRDLGEVRALVATMSLELGHVSADLKEIVITLKELDKSQRSLELRVQAAESKLEIVESRLTDTEYKLWDRDHEKWRTTMRKAR